MNELFLKIINMSISASWLILAVLILRLVLKKAPKWVNVLLWGIVAVRLICPLSFESALSLIPSSETIPLDIEMAAKPTIDSGVPAINSVVNPVLSSFAPPQHVLTSANPLQIWIPILNIIWLIGVGALLLYTAVSYWRLCRKVDTAVRYKGNIFQSENVSSPFVLGIIKPRIYLPFNMNGQDLEHVVAHEQAHIRRKDHWWKPLGFLLLTIHWFNPLMWLAYVLLCRDIELGSMVADLGVVMALFLGIVLSSLFAGEWHDNTSTLVLTTRNGWGKIALAKILTGLAFTVELFALLAVSNVISQLFFMGTAGWDMPIQNIKLIAVAPMNMLQAEIYEYAFVLLGAIGFAGIVMFISAAVKNNVLTLLLSLAVVYGPMMIAEYLPYKMQKALDLIPLVGSSTDIFRTNTFRILGKLIWSPYLLITIPVLIGILCMPFAIKSWSRRMKA